MRFFVLMALVMSSNANAAPIASFSKEGVCFEVHNFLNVLGDPDYTSDLKKRMLLGQVSRGQKNISDHAGPRLAGIWNPKLEVLKSELKKGDLNGVGQRVENARSWLGCRE